MKSIMCGNSLHVNGLTTVNSNTKLGNNVNFNGLTVIGEGNVLIGDNFHSGQGCTIITQNHDYDGRDCISYDSKKFIIKDVVIKSITTN